MELRAFFEYVLTAALPSDDQYLNFSRGQTIRAVKSVGWSNRSTGQTIYPKAQTIQMVEPLEFHWSNEPIGQTIPVFKTFKCSNKKNSKLIRLRLVQAIRLAKPFEFPKRFAVALCESRQSQRVIIATLCALGGRGVRRHWHARQLRVCRAWNRRTPQALSVCFAVLSRPPSLHLPSLSLPRRADRAGGGLPYPAVPQRRVRLAAFPGEPTHT
jgi:hypothetical protein